MFIQYFQLITEPAHKAFIFGMKLSDVLSIFTSLGVIAAIITACVSFFKYRSDFKEKIKNDIILNYNALKVNIESKIETFYGPCMSLREESRILYSVFATELKRESSGTRFRTLRYLCDTQSEKLSISDASILKQIIDVSQKNLDLIETKGWVVSNPELSSLLGKLCAHFRILKLAYDEKLIGKGTELDGIVFPLEIDGAIYNEVRKMKVKLNRDTKIVRVDEKYKTTIDYYDFNYKDYYARTINVNMTPFYDKFIKYLVDGGSILDVGCGVGRDTRNFIKMGFKVSSFDLSLQMVNMCNRYPFAFCEHNSVLDIQFYDQFDGVWANASLLHLDSNDFWKAIDNLITAMKVGGILFISLKIYTDHLKIEERKFYRHDVIFLKDKLFLKYKTRLLEQWVSKKEENNDKFINFLFKKE